MTNDAQRIAIAEAMGFIFEKYPGKKLGPFGWRLSGKYYPQIPDYPNDLNAMHEAEKTLAGDDRGRYFSWLVGRVANVATFDCRERDFLVAHATAAQRSESFLRTIEKWVG